MEEAKLKQEADKKAAKEKREAEACANGKQDALVGDTDGVASEVDNGSDSGMENQSSHGVYMTRTLMNVP